MAYITREGQSMGLVNGASMYFLHQELQLAEGAGVKITLDTAANVQLLDQANYELYKQNKPYQYEGGYATESPVVLVAPTAGRWHLTVDLGDGVGHVRASCRRLAAQVA